MTLVILTRTVQEANSVTTPALSHMNCELCVFVCRHRAGHTRADAGLHPAQLHFHPGGSGGHEVHHLHGRSAGAEGQSGSSWRSYFHLCWYESFRFTQFVSTQGTDCICLEEVTQHHCLLCFDQINATFRHRAYSVVCF